MATLIGTSINWEKLIKEADKNADGKIDFDGSSFYFVSNVKLRYSILYNCTIFFQYILYF